MEFSCYLIGEESLLVQCGELLRQRGHRIQGVISSDQGIGSWAAGLSIPVVKPGAGLAERMESDFDWLFSIANLSIMPDAVLDQAKSGAINFHDGPLPLYAGLNSPNWALLHGESRHGVSWHRMEGAVDEGRILAQRLFEVPPLSTALALNTQCYEAAIESFSDVLGRLESGDDGGEAQDLSLRTYYGLHDRPEAMALIDWTQDADAIVRMVRALDYGAKYANPLHIAKLEVGDRTILVRRAEVAHGSGEPGRILEQRDNGVVVAAGHGAVRLLELTDNTGAKLEPTILPLGDVLPCMSAGDRAELTEKNKTLCKADGFWGRRFSQLDEIGLPQMGAPRGAPEYASVEFDTAKLTGDVETAAIAAWLSRIGDKTHFHVGYVADTQRDAVGPHGQFYCSTLPLWIAAAQTTSATVAMLSKELRRVEARPAYALDLLARYPNAAALRNDVVIAPGAKDPIPGAGLTIADGTLHYDLTRLAKEDAEQVAMRLGVFLAAFQEDETPIADLPMLTLAERRQVLFEWNQTAEDYEQDKTVAQLFEAQVDQTPEAPALVYENISLTYAELDQRANKVAQVLRDAGLQPDGIVGLYCYRTTDLVVGALGIMKAGGAYLPLDPDYPAERIRFMLEDSHANFVLTHREARPGLVTSARVIVLDDDVAVQAADEARGGSEADEKNLAYVIYTSGSTGRPKGVMIEHRNVANFFAGMDQRIERGEADVWLAVTSLSFDIAVLEIFWTLTRGFKVVLHRDRERVEHGGLDPAIAARPMAFGVMYWGNDDGQGPRKYELLLEGAKLADRSGFNSIWTPERHFHAFGGPYPNPAVTGAAVAAVTQNLEVRGGSCVVPLHHPIRIAEEWAVIDNLTNGRAAIGVAAGWHPDDFVLRPENTPPKNKDAMFETIEVVRRLWRGEAVDFPREDGSMLSVVTQPRPVSKELQVWVTVAGNPDTYRRAGEIGANLLTHLLGQSLDEVAEKVRIYRDARAKAGFDPATGRVTLMLHTYLAETRDEAREVAREPMKDYLRSAAGLIKQYAWAFPAFKKPKGVENSFELDLRSLSTEEVEGILDFAFTRYFEDSGLFGTVDDAVARVNQCKGYGIDEIACLVDYGIETPDALKSLALVADVIKQTNRPVSESEKDFSVAAQIREHNVTHMQCTPSMARMLTMDDRMRGELGQLNQLMVGGEALPGALVADLRGLTEARIENMYGPTETTIWSSTATAEAVEGIAPIGTPIANTQLYVLDAHRNPVPVGVPGELYIGGDGVTRGYLGRPELTAENFRTDPFRGGEARMYRTGDLVRWKKNGTVDFLGRVDHQVKLRGYRIELGEIEARLNELGAVQESVVIAREDVAGDKRLVAYLLVREEVEDEVLRTELRKNLPDYMVPSHFVTLDAFPLTPNKKIDRKKLPPPEEVQRKIAADYVAPENETERKIAEVWKRVLGVQRIGSKDSFFDLGGHSLLAVQAHREIKEALGVNIGIADVFQFPTLGGLADFCGDAGGKAKEALSKTASRAAARRDARRRR